MLGRVRVPLVLPMRVLLSHRPSQFGWKPDLQMRVPCRVRVPLVRVPCRVRVPLVVPVMVLQSVVLLPMLLLVEAAPPLKVAEVVVVVGILVHFQLVKVVHGWMPGLGWKPLNGPAVGVPPFLLLV